MDSYIGVAALRAHSTPTLHVEKISKFLTVYNNSPPVCFLCTYVVLQKVNDKLFLIYNARNNEQVFGIKWLCVDCGSLVWKGRKDRVVAREQRQVWGW